MRVLRILLVVAICAVANKAQAIDHATASIFSAANAASYNEINNYESLSAYTKAGYLGSHSNWGGGCCRREASCCDNIWAGFCGERRYNFCKPWFQINCNHNCKPKCCLNKCWNKLRCMAKSCETKVEVSCGCQANDCQAKESCCSKKRCGLNMNWMHNAGNKMHCFMHRCKSACSFGCGGCDSCDSQETILEEALPVEKKSKQGKINRVNPPKPKVDNSVKTIELFPKLSALNFLK